jgi:hypothetical protein
MSVVGVQQSGANDRFLGNPRTSWSGAECLLRVEPRGSTAVRRMTPFGVTSSLPSAPVKVRSPSDLPTFRHPDSRP